MRLEYQLQLTGQEAAITILNRVWKQQPKLFLQTAFELGLALI